MKGFVVILIALWFSASAGIAQSSLGKTDDLGRIAIAAVVPDEAGIPGGAQRNLQNRLTQVATLNGLGATASSQFAILPMVSIISQDVTPTAPPMVSLNIDVTLYMVDAKSQTIFSQTQFRLKVLDGLRIGPILRQLIISILGTVSFVGLLKRVKRKLSSIITQNVM
ncbi:MAG: hypothetical protein PHD00_03695 [Bacteroidales bacterium]|nr:hypothetical protein [Bacteroidales bacterium]